MSIWVYITLVGDEKAYLFFIPLIYFLLSRKLGWRLLLLAVFSAACVHALKDVFKLPRPPQELWKVSASGYAFPSGHATVASAFWSYFSMKMKSLMLYLLAAIIVILIASSRVILGVHYLRDVLGGIGIGILIALFFLYIDKKTQEMKEKKKDKSLAIGAFLVLLISPYLLLKLPSEGAIFLGFALAHVAVYFFRFKEIIEVKKRIASLGLCLALIFAGYLAQIPLLLPLFGFLSCFAPQALWHFIDKRIEKQR